MCSVIVLGGEKSVRCRTVTTPYDENIPVNVCADSQQVVGRNTIRAGVREESVPVLRRARVQSCVQHIRGEEKGPDRIVQHADRLSRKTRVSSRTFLSTTLIIIIII